ncbi:MULTISPECIES: EpsG family protein [unclassified Acinetobacter]|uniref:EpsG family protein n=1 Tax=unclassified Acinetobacter TaxID=196816 RepID=UPI0015D30FCF|nr:MULTISPECIES: EpsG family protein [unclassified Acinetobacter]
MDKWLIESKRDVELKIVLFIISPFFATIYSFRRANTKSSYLVFFLSSIFFGLSFTVDSGKDYITGVGLDGQSYREKFESAKYISNYDYIDGLLGFLELDEGKKDYYFETVAFFLSRITDNYHIMFMIFAIVFSYFSLKSFKFFTSEKKFDFSVVTLILCYLFLYNQIFNINGVRFWTAAWIAVYCIFQIYRNNNKIYLLLALITPFFHGAYWVFVVIIFASLLLRKFEKLWIVLFAISFFASALAVELIQSFSGFLPTFLSKLAESYTSEESLSKTWSGFGWLPILFKNMVLCFITGIILLFIKNSKQIKSNPKTKDLYYFLLMWVTIFNFLMFVPSLGNRFIQLSYPIISYIWLVNFKDEKYNKFILFLPLAFIWDIQKILSYYFQVLDFGFYFSSPIYLVYKYIIAY